MRTAGFHLAADVPTTEDIAELEEIADAEALAVHLGFHWSEWDQGGDPMPYRDPGRERFNAD